MALINALIKSKNTNLFESSCPYLKWIKNLYNPNEYRQISFTYLPQIFRFYCVVTYFTGCKKPPKNANFHVFFTGWPHIFVHCANTVWARGNLKADLSSTMNYLSLNITLVTVVWAVLQITAWNHWSNSEKLCSVLMATSWLLRIV